MKKNKSHNPTAETRKRKNKNRKLSRLEIRLYPEEKKAIQEKAAKVNSTASELVRESLLRVQVWTATDKKAHKERTLQIAKIGANLNHIARWCNTHKATAEAVEVIAHLQAISQELENLSE